MRQGRSFTAEYKAEAVRLVQVGDRSVREVAKALDLTETALREWVKAAAVDADQLNPCVETQDSGYEKAGGSGSNAGAAEGSQGALLQQELDDQSAGGLTCSDPVDCVNKCVAEQKYCWAAYAVHPRKPDQTGELFQCIDRWPPAKAGGSYTCLYKFTNGDVCIFAYGSKLGPFTLPAPPPLCVYKTP